MCMRTAIQPLRTLTDMTEITASIMTSAGDGRRTRVTIRLMMMEGKTRRSRLVEEEQAKETEEDHHIRHPEEMEINLVLHPDRRVSLTVMHRVLRLLKYFPLWLNLLKSRLDRLLRRSPHLRIPLKSFPVLRKI